MVVWETQLVDDRVQEAEASVVIQCLDDLLEGVH